MRITETAAAAAIVFAILGAPVTSAETTGNIKQLMGENFGGLQAILYALISGNYVAVPKQVEIIEEHATQLTRMVPANAEAQRDQFLAYAFNLRAHALDLKEISEALLEHDAERAKPAPDYLREAIASHYGGMVSMCVACHNRFRPPTTP